MVRATATMPGPRGSFLVGNTWDYEQDRDGFLRDCSHRYGDVFRFGRDIVVVSDPGLIHQVLADTNTNFVLVMKPDQDLNTAVYDIASWMRGRRHSNRGLGQALLTAHARRLDRSLERRLDALAGDEFTLLDSAQELCSQVSVDFCLHTDADDIGRSTALSNRLALVDMAAVGRVARMFHARSRYMLTRVENECLGKLGRQVRTRLAEGYTGPPRDLLDVMVAPQTGAPLEADHIARMLKTILAAARGIPGSALAWIMRELARNSTMCEEVRAESGALGDAVASADPNRLPYTYAAVQEILRMHPPTWLISRAVACPTQVGCWPVRVGERVVFSPYQIHHDPRWWEEDPASFRPQRWMTGHRPCALHAYLPFGGGPRICPGARLGLLQLTLATARMARHYRVEVEPDDPDAPRHSVLRVPPVRRARLDRRANTAQPPPTGLGTEQP